MDHGSVMAPNDCVWLPWLIRLLPESRFEISLVREAEDWIIMPTTPLPPFCSNRLFISIAESEPSIAPPVPHASKRQP